MAKKLQSFDVTARVIIIAGITIKAESYQDALTQSEGLTEQDFVKVLDDYNDGSIRIISVSKTGMWKTDDHQ